MWVPVHDEEWDGDIPVGLDSPTTTTPRIASDDGKAEEGEVVFEKSALPWQTGLYEIRYHYDGKYNVMSLDGPFEVYVEKPEDLDFDSIRKSLMHIVPLCLDSDPSLIPLSCKTESEAGAHTQSVDNEEGLGEEPKDDMRDPDDFRFWSERQAKRISGAINQTFGVEIMPEVVLADANLTALANRILVSKELLTGPNLRGKD